MATYGQQPILVEQDRQGRLFRHHKALAVSTAGAKSYSAAEIMMYPTINRDPNGAARTDTLPTAASLLALMNRKETGVCFEIDVINWNTSLTTSNSHRITLATNTGLTLIGSPMIPAGGCCRLRFEVSGSATFNVYILNQAANYSPSATVSTVSQATSITTGVTLNAYQGIITTQNASAAAAAEQSFTLTNSTIGANSMVVISIMSYAGAGTPLIYVSTSAAGSCVISITNLHASNSLDSALTIGFKVENPA